MDRDISFASFNLYNLQLPGKPTHPGAAPFSADSYQRRLVWAGAMLRELDADVIAFQELWSAQALRDLFASAGLDADYELHFIAEEWYDIAVAAAVRKPWRVAAKALHKHFPADFRLLKRRHGQPGADAQRTDDDIEVSINLFSRTVIQLTLNHDDPQVPPVEVFCAHLKSKHATLLDRPEADNPALRPHTAALGAALSTIRRTAEAAALRMILTGVLKNTDRAAVLLGDLNDGVHANTLSILTTQPVYRRYAKSRKAGSNDTGLYAASFLQALSDFQDVAYTYLYKDVREQLDHILVSEQFYDFSKKRHWSFKDQRIWNDHLDQEAPSGPARASSDHGIVRARFLWDPA
jgi:endonuclease/exonuclease/phosphatase family metal-dependent hydrolase